MPAICGAIGNRSCDITYILKRSSISNQHHIVKQNGLSIGGVGDIFKTYGDDSGMYNLYFCGNADWTEADHGWQQNSSSILKEIIDGYKAIGTEIFSFLKGRYSAVFRDKSERNLYLITDKISSQSIYYHLNNKGLVFSTRLQPLIEGTDIDPDLNPSAILEYLNYFRNFGNRTPFRDIMGLCPATILSLKISRYECETNQYWRPTHNEIEITYDELIQEFLNRLKSCVKSLCRRFEQVGLLLSAGSDSRLILGIIDDLNVNNVKAYHLSDWMNRETRIVQRLAHMTDIELEILTRGKNHEEKKLQEVPELLDFAGTYTQGHIIGFREKLQDEVDALMTGHFGDTLWDGTQLPTSSDLPGPLGSIFVSSKPISNIEEYKEWKKGSYATANFFDFTVGYDDGFENKIYRNNGEVVDHGIKFNNINDAVMSHLPFFHRSSADQGYINCIQSTAPWLHPLGSDELIDLYLDIPKNHLINNNIIKDAISELNKPFSRLPHGLSKVPLYNPPYIHRARRSKRTHNQELLIDIRTLPWLNQGSWGDLQERIRYGSFTEDTLEEKRDILRHFDFINQDKVWEFYQSYMDRSNSDHFSLHLLFSLLMMPSVEYAIDSNIDG